MTIPVGAPVADESGAVATILGVATTGPALAIELTAGAVALLRLRARHRTRRRKRRKSQSPKR